MNTYRHLHSFLGVVGLVILPFSSVNPQIHNTYPVNSNELDQSETAIAVHPEDPNVFMAVWNDFTNGYYSKPGYGFSIDGGVNWNIDVVPNRLGEEYEYLIYGLDPSAGVDDLGNFYYCYFASTDILHLGDI